MTTQSSELTAFAKEFRVDWPVNKEPSVIPQVVFPTLAASWEPPDVLLVRVTTQEKVDPASMRGLMDQISSVQEKGTEYFLVIDLGQSSGVSLEARNLLHGMQFKWKCKGIFLVGGSFASRTVITLMSRIAYVLGRLKTDARSVKTLQDAYAELAARRSKFA